jgi:hypothetical protein
MKITRRKLALGAVASAAALAQTPAPPRGSSDEELLKAAREQVRRNAATLATVPLPMTAEPAFQFKA